MHPKNAITMVGDIDRCWQFCYRIPTAQRSPPTSYPLLPLTHGPFAFMNIVVSELSHMRPLCLPALLGMHYWHVAYRIPVRFQPIGEDAIEGLYFLRSDASSNLMKAAGNMLTDFRFHKCRLEIEVSSEKRSISVQSPDAPAEMELSYDIAPSLAEGSPFQDLDEAKTFLKYKPAGISIEPEGVAVLRVKRVESAWRSKLVHAVRAEFAFLRQFEAMLEVCCEVEPVQYQWIRAERFPIEKEA